MKGRISSIVCLASPCDSIADIGCDHGYIGLQLLKKDKCSETVEVDISEPSLQKAVDLFTEKGISSRARFVVGDGLAPAKGVDAAIIAGLGGKLIIDLINKDIHIARAMDYLILQPNNSAAELRRYVTEHGFTIIDEAICYENRRHYAIMRIEPSRTLPLSEMEAELGPINLERNHPILMDYARYRLKVKQKMICTMNKGGVRDQAYFDAVHMRNRLEEFLEDNG
ncbi:MAG: SAM-dependent methyltransferase [Clostridiales bacterium]|nr:SAM-dependent methyltransferase [Clostridiales bacterium]